MPNIDASIPLGTKVPDGMTTIGNMLNTARSAQALQLGNVELQKNEIALQERRGIQQMFANPDAFKGADGQMDFNRLIEEGMKVAPTTFPAMLPQIIQAKKLGTEAEQALSNLHESTRAGAGQWFMAQRGKPLEQVSAEAAEIKKLNPALAPAIDSSLKLLAMASQGGQQALDSAYLKLGQAAMPPTSQADVMRPSGPTVSTGQVDRAVNTQPMAGPVGATIPGTEVQRELPPTTPVFNNETQQQGYLGPQPPNGAPPAGNAQVPPEVQASRDAWRRRAIQNEIDNVQRGMPDGPQKRDALAALQTELNAGGPVSPPAKSRFVASSPKLGAEANVSGTVDVVNKDWASTSESAKTASQDIGVLQNIKKYAPGAVSGVASDRRAYVAGLAGLLGMDAGQLEKTNTDLLAKNTNMLALAGGDTNLAKLMAESANPNTHMTKEAITDASNQVIAQRKLALAKQQYMSHFKGDPDTYTKELAAFNAIADPRALQLPDMAKEDKQRMLAAMSEGERKDFIAKTRKLQAIGILQ
jgi:hypothetical protein